ncbi:putative cyclin [Helianthus anomalus]
MWVVDEKEKLESLRSRNKKPQSSLTRSKAACALNYKPKNIVDINVGDVDNELAQVEYVEDIYKFYKLIEEQSCLWTKL